MLTLKLLSEMNQSLRFLWIPPKIWPLSKFKKTKRLLRSLKKCLALNMVVTKTSLKPKSSDALDYKPLTIDSHSLLRYNFLTMQLMGTITSKRQLTIPASIFEELGFGENQKVLVENVNGALQVKSMVNLVKELSGSLKALKEDKNKDIDEIIEDA